MKTMLDRLRRWTSGSIRRRLVVGVALVHAVLMSLFASEQAIRQLEALREQSLDRATTLVRMTAVNAVSWVLADDVRGLSELVRSLRGQPQLMYAMVVDVDGQVLAHTDRDKVGFFVEDPVSRAVLTGPPTIHPVVANAAMVEVAAPVTAGKRVVGWARLALDRAEENAAIRATLIQAGLAIAAAIVAGTLCALWIARRLTRDLAQLGEAADLLGQGARVIAHIPGPTAEIARLERAFHQMAATIWQREDELRRSVDQLATSNTDLERFAYLASHDLQEPLRSVVGFAQLLEKRYGGRLDPDADQFIHFIVEGGKRMSQQIQGMLDFSRVDATAAPFRRAALDDCLNQAVDNLTRAMATTDAHIHRAPLPVVWGDPVQLMLLFQNLIGNAIKFHRPDHRPEISVDWHQTEDHWAEISVTDNGIGIDPALAEDIFLLFRRLHGADQYSGRGIGLAMCRRIVERHGGSIRAQAAPDGGSIFILRLPLPATIQADDDLVDNG